MSHISLEQWQALIAVVEHEGYAAAAEALNKSQSSISYGIQKIETQLGLAVFRIEGRKAVLTPAGKALYQRAQVLVEDARQIEALARQFAAGWEPEVRIAMDTLFPETIMLEVIEQFTAAHPQIRIELLETVLSGTDEALLHKTADIVIGGRIPPGFMGEPLLLIEFCAVAHPQHPLHHLERTLNYQDLRLHRQLVVRDSGSRDIDAGWLGAQQRLTFGNLTSSIAAASRGLGYAWYPLLKIEDALAAKTLKPLPLKTGAKRQVQLNLILAQGEDAGPATQAFANLLKTTLETALTTKKDSSVLFE